MSAPDTRVTTQAALADVISQRVLDHPAVAHLDGGPFGTVASYLPGRRVVGVRVDEEDGAVDLAVVLWVGHPLQPVVAALRRAVREVVGPVRINVTVADLHSVDDEPLPDPPGDGASTTG